VQNGLKKGRHVREKPELGPKLEPLVEQALRSLLEICNVNNGFVGPSEKQWAVEHLRAIWHESDVGFDPDEVAVWAETHGWTIQDGDRLRAIAAGVREGKRFLSAERGFAATRCASGRWSQPGANNKRPAALHPEAV
jgi:hypothetical protein